METDKQKEEEFVKASVDRIVEWARSVDMEIPAWQLTTIYAELKTMYETGHRHCDEDWQAEMKDRGQERDLVE
ncbi:MAG: hypothetical protein M0R32_09105 [Candidatus Cloacimonetes bacterium]|jgi:hypothetical protein|nr:hypothetical protein [Candidatus Cloacimonadota bacterium]